MGTGSDLGKKPKKKPQKKKTTSHLREKNLSIRPRAKKEWPILPERGVSQTGFKRKRVL